jgi:hypothetical protein
MTTGRQHSDTLGGFTLTSASFPDFYSRIQNLRFPISVADVLELRDLINHSADVYEEAADIPDNREFRESLESAIHSFGIENSHHCERLIRVLTMLRSMHYQHTVSSRNAEQQLREWQAQNRMDQRAAMRNGVIALVVTGLLLLGWMLPETPGLLLKILPLISAMTAFHFFHMIPIMESKREALARDLNEVLRKRVEALNWRTLIHKLSLLLGYKKIQGIEVFRHEQAENHDNPPLLH